MIHLTSTRRTDTVSDAVGCMRAFGGVFVLTGSFALAAAIDGGEVVALWERVGIAAIGASHLLAGLWIGWARRTQAVASRSGIEWTQWRAFRGRTSRTFSPSEITDVVVVVETDSDGDEVYRPMLLLASGERVHLTDQVAPMREQVDTIVAALRARLGKTALGPAHRQVTARLVSPEAVSV